MNRLLPIAFAIVCVIALVLSIDPAFLNWLVIRAWVLLLALAPGLALVIACLGYGLGNGWKFQLGITAPPDGELRQGSQWVERLILAFACGVGVVASYAFLFGLFDMGLLDLLVLIGILNAVLCIRIDIRRNAVKPDPARSAGYESGDGLACSGEGPVCFGSRVAWIVFGLAAVLIGMTALAPPLIFDVTEYHLGAWTNYLSGGDARFVPTPYNFYARFPFPIESIYFTGLVLTPGIDTAPKLFNAVCVFACAGLAWCFARRLGGGRAASAIAALLALAHPVMLDVSIDAMIDAPVALLVAGSFYAGFVALGLFDGTDLTKLKNRSDASTLSGSSDSPDTQPTESHRSVPAPHFTFVAIFLFGVALAAKYTVAQLYLLPWALLIFAPLVWQQIRNRPGRRALMWGCIGAAVPCVIWFGKNIAWYGNPLEPFFQHIFRPNDAAAIAREKFYIESHFPQSPLSAQYWQTLLPRLHEFGWVLLVACGGWIFMRGSRRSLWRFVAIAAVAFLLWNTVRASENRFLLPLFVMLAAFAARGAEAIPAVFARRAVYCALIIFAAVSSVKHGLRVHKSEVVSYLLDFAPSSRTTDYTDIPEATPREKYMETNLGDLGEVVNYVNRELSPDARLLLVYEARPYLFRTDTEYNVVWDDSWLLDAIRPAKNADEAIEWLRHEGITHVLINRQELLRYIQQYARREQLLRLGVGAGDDPRAAWLATAHPEDLYPPFYRDPDWDRLRPIVHELLTRFDEKATERRGADSAGGAGTRQPKALNVILTPMSAM